MAYRGSMRAMIFAVWNLLCLVAVASADQQSPDVTQAVNEIIAACAILPMNTIEEPLSAKLEEFLRQSSETKSAKSSDLTDLFAQLPTDTEKGLEQVKDPRARDFFFSAYFTCIRQQTSLKLKSWNIPLE
jgi:hypothetical protein